MTLDEKRAYLKACGWKRQDRAIGKNLSQEMWVFWPKDHIGMSPLPVTLETALKRQKKVDNVGGL